MAAVISKDQTTGAYYTIEKYGYGEVVYAAGPWPKRNRRTKRYIKKGGSMESSVAGDVKRLNIKYVRGSVLMLRNPESSQTVFSSALLDEFVMHRGKVMAQIYGGHLVSAWRVHPTERVVS